MGSLTEDPAFLATTFVVVDFETTTPTGHPAQPVEVAALAFRWAQGAWARSDSFTSLIQPPAFAPVTRTPALAVRSDRLLAAGAVLESARL
jgi:DNA polymerase III subunit epsilon